MATHSKAHGRDDAAKTSGASGKSTRGGAGAHGSGASTKESRDAHDQGPKWRGGGKKGENEQSTRSSGSK